MQVTTSTLIRTLLLSAALFACSSFSGAKAETYTIELGSYGPRPTVEVYFGARGPYTFILDTGARGIVIDEGLAETLGIEVTGTARMGAPGAADAPERPLYGALNITLGEMSLSVDGARGLDLASMLPGENPPVGVLGFWDIADGFATLDLGAGRLIIDTEKHLKTGQDGAIPFTSTPPFPFPEFTITVDGKELKAHLDSGSPGGVTLPGEWMKRFSFVEGPEISGKVNLVGGARDIWTGKLDGTMTVGGYTQENPAISFVEGFPGANVGSGLLRHLIVEMDLENNLIRIVPKP